jgi:glycosidase
VLIFELNSRLYRKRFDELAAEHLDRLAALGFDWIWAMGVWHIGEAPRELARTFAPDFEGSPYAIAEYAVDPELGGDAAFDAFVERAHTAGLKVMVDFVPNHMAKDSPLLDVHPEYAIHSNPALRPEHENDYYDHPKGRLAHGKDPYFPGWTDTVQLDYAFPALRAHQIDVLKSIARRADGVRCDMAMLVLKEHVKTAWFPRVDPATFQDAYPREFWAEAIEAVRADKPAFAFMAEVYWDKEPYLQQLGFDHTYNKKLYDLLAHDKAAGEVAWELGNWPENYLRRSVHFLENHDEERAAARFGPRSRPSAILSYGIPGAAFVHQGQMEGLHEKLPVQRREPLQHENPDPALQAFYAKLLGIMRAPLFREGSMKALGEQHGAVLVLRRHEGRTALIASNATGDRRSASPPIELSAHDLGFADHARLHAVDLWMGAPIRIGDAPSKLSIAEGAVASFAETHALLLELSALPG